ncbi:uncharacterized protein LOC117822870 [Notolabrus celidotus]|uniref:uncharacterized protein LOC117822870 n=1 Tax=Notolabrus celidotus TaxID=1203425 RepID=UPI0014908904|nr:uncharacterized protein LOC117822870 [Notolabrus celidotus]
MYIIVEFTEDKSVNIVPASWFEDGVTWWPDFTSDERINRAVKKQVKPGPDWKLFDARVISRSSDYTRAREKLRASLVCNTSELQSDDEEEVLVRKRKIRPRIIFGETDSDSEPEEGKKRRRTNLSSTQAPPISPPISQPIPTPTPNIPWNETFPTPSRPLPDPRRTGSLCFTADAPLVPIPPPSSAAGSLPEFNNHSFTPTFRLGKTGTGSFPCSAAQQHILTLLEHIKEQQMQLAAAVNNLAARIGTETPVAEIPHNISIPLATMSEVEGLEEWLKDARHSLAKQNMISALGAVGGQNTKRVTWNILSRIYSDNVAKQINWKGVNGKKGFKEMVTRSLIIRAVRKNHSTIGATDSEIDSCVIRWFNLASDRGGGRRDRAKAKDAASSDHHTSGIDQQ